MARLPNLNGWEAFQKMRKIQLGLKALFAAGFPSPEVEAELDKGEMGSIIMKPYRLDKVLEKISDILLNPSTSMTDSTRPSPNSSQALNET